MLAKIAAFEARYQLRSPLFVVAFLIFFLLTFGAVTVDQIQIGAKGNVNINSPYAILQTVGIMNLMAIFVVTAFVANVVIRDDETGFAPILRATRISKFDYLVGRFSGALLVAFLVMLSVPLAILIGSKMPWLDAEKVGPLVLQHYLWATFVFSLPTLVLMSAGFFALATATRSMMWSYVGAVAFMVLFVISRGLLSDPSLDTASSLADPFAVGTLGRITKYWTTADRNTLLPALSGVLLWNRLLWLGVGALLFALAYRLFRFDVQGQRLDKAAKASKAAKPGKADPAPSPRPLGSPSDSGYARWLQFKALTRFDMAFVFKSPAFFVLLMLGVFNSIGSLIVTGEARGVSYLPVTRATVEALMGSFTLIPIIIAVYYAGELVWRDRERRIHEIVDASAAPNWAFLLPKIIAIAGVLLATFVVGALTGAVFQLVHGYTHLEPLAYALWFVLPSFITALLLAVLSVFAQALVPHKFIGWGLMLVYAVIGMVMGQMGFEHKLYNYADTANVPLSDMNGMGHFWIGRAWHQVYWLAFAAMLLVATHLMWRRGAETRLSPRLARLGGRLKGTPGVLLGLFTLAWVGSGSWIFYNSNVLNKYETEPESEQLQADAERELLGFEKLPLPSITHVTLKVDLFPKQIRAVTEGSYRLENRTGQALSTVHVRLDPLLKIEQLELDGATLQKEYARFGYRIYSLATPMQPGEQRQLRFKTVRGQLGFVNDRPQTQIVDNGSFLNNFALTPVLGVNRNIFIQDRSKRRKYGLPAELRVAKLEDEAANAHHYLRHDSDWVTADITLSTDADQVPLAPGYTVSDTTAETPMGRRRTLVTKTEAPIHNFFSLQSARYAIERDQWTGKDGQKVDLSVYFHPPHASNVPRMLNAMKTSLDVFSTAFSNYQFRQTRILEFPAYSRFAQAFAGTVPYSEGIGFIQAYKEEQQDDNIDLVSYVTAHEIGHQWWAHQVVGADKQGMTLLSESFAQYSALLVMEKMHGRDQLRKFLKLELDRYLRDRGGERVEELPLARVEDQGYVHYRKGALTMYWLKEVVGEDVVNRALQKLIAQYAFKSAPYPASTDFLRLLRAEAGPQHEQLITDLFEKITLYDLKASEATAKKRADGKYEVTFSVEAKKLYADGKGKETEAPLAEGFEIGAFTAEPGKKGFSKAAVLLLERRPLVSGKQQITLLLDAEPKFVGVDPYNMRIDRNADDNLAKVSLN
ncbi:M1 family aminopeptidase [Paucibacter sp. APW11]|uniref:M1 family aminopeptidase n=1 Tax=Roseateles aquae TaxID=3077235 RepID=A0ABU3PBT6_9BURK|nr:M1 family aminopeptidase [Paucibacter sp. APW11]MDT9000026.1 M1 family aminopeptidase [Paucibacter sp. APW11]